MIRNRPFFTQRPSVDTVEKARVPARVRIRSRFSFRLKLLLFLLAEGVAIALLFFALGKASGDQDQSLPVPGRPSVADVSASDDILTAAALLPGTPTRVRLSETGWPTDPEQYLNSALNFIQYNSVVDIDWKAWRKRVLAEAGKPLTRADTHFAIRDALAMLGDNHSQLLSPDVYLGEITDTAGMWLKAPFPERKVNLIGTSRYRIVPGRPSTAEVHEGDVIESINGQPALEMTASDFYRSLYSGSHVRLTLLREGFKAPIDVSVDHPFFNRHQLPSGRRFAGNIGYVQMPGVVVNQISEMYPEIVQQIIRDLDQPAACGWVVDVQGNTGGYFDLMGAGIGPVLGTGDAATIVYKNVRGPDRVPWSYKLDALGSALYYGTYRARSVHEPYLYQLKAPMPPVAVLTDQWTASAGEAVVVSFRGRPNTRTFGEPTLGIPTVNTGFDLSDWAQLILTAGQEEDRTGRLYGITERIKPDEFVPVGSPDQQGTEADPVLAAALKWLRAQPACSK